MLFSAGFAVVQALVVVIALLSNPVGGLAAGSRVSLVLTLLLIPTVAACLAASALNGVSPRRLFDERVERPVARAALGMASAAIALAPMILVVSVLSEYVPDVVATGACGAVSAALTVISLPRRRAAFCVHCGYDLHALPAGAGCPECGAFGSG